MEENNSSERSPSPAVPRDTTDVISRNSELLKTQSLDDMSVENSFADLHSDILLNEASKIFQIGVEKDLAIFEKNKIIQDAMETIETMKKNIYHIQMEYEKLDQNYHKEVENSAEALKRMDITRNMIESATQYSNILAISIKQLEDDKFKIAEFYNEMQIRQEEEEEKRKKIEVILKEMEDFTKNLVSQFTLEKEKTEEKLKIMIDNMSRIEDKLRCEINAKVELEARIEKYKDEMSEMKAKLVLEQSERLKHQLIQSQLKRKVLHQKAEDEKKLNSQKIIHKKKFRILISKLNHLQERLYTSDKSISNYLTIIKNLESKVIDLNGTLQEANAQHGRELKDFEEKLKDCLNEKRNLDDFIRTLEEEKGEGSKKIKILTEDNALLLNAQEAMKLELQDKQYQADMLLSEKLSLETQLQEMSLGIESKIQKIKALEMEIKSHNAEELAENIMIYKQKLENCNAVENELRNEITHLKETISKQSREIEETVRENHATIQQLEIEVSELQAQKEAAEKKLNDKNSEFTNVKNELSSKTADLEKITQEFEEKMKMVSNEVGLSEGYKSVLEKEKLLNWELQQKIQKLKEEIVILDRNLKEALERENLFKKNLEKEREDTEKNVKKLKFDIEQGENLLKIQEDKLNRVQNELQEMAKLSDKLEASEMTNVSLKKSLDASEANAEAYKIVIQKLEGEAAKRKNIENETIKNLQSEITQLKQQNQKKENISTLSETPKRRNIRGERTDVRKDKSENVGSSSKKTPSARKLLSTPNRLLESPFSSPKFRSISPIMKPHDPYEYDSDSSYERINVRVAPKRNIFTTKRKK